MKHPIIFSIIILLLCSKIYGQDAVRLPTCKDEIIARQVDSLKKEFTIQGYIVAKEAAVTMVSELEMAVMVALTEGSKYQFVFIGEVSSKLYEVRMFDSEEKQVEYQKKVWGEVDGNVINFSFVPKFSEFYAIRPLQINNKKKNICGYVMLLKKVK